MAYTPKPSKPENIRPDMTPEVAASLLGWPAGRMLASHHTKDYSIWVWENGITKILGKRQFGWTCEHGSEWFIERNRMQRVSA